MQASNDIGRAPEAIGPDRRRKEVPMSAALTLHEAKNPRPALVLAAVLLAAVLVALVGLAVSRTASSEQAAPGADHPVVGSTGSAGIPYVGSGPAAEIIRGSLGATTSATTSGASGFAIDASGIQYVGTGPAAELIRASLNAPTVTLIPYVGTGPAAETIRGERRGDTTYFSPDFWRHGK
jgi:hypothetical protein